MRRRRWVIVLLSIFSVSLLLSQLSKAGTIFRVNEAEIKVLLEEKQTSVSLAFENPTGRSFPARVRLELLDPEGKVAAVTESNETIAKGSGAILMPLPMQLAGLSASERGRVLWYRLRYQVTLTSQDAGAKIEGIVSLSEITPDIFQINVVSPKSVREGARYRAQVRAVHPITSRAVKNVRVEASMKFDDGDKEVTLAANGMTDAEGYAALDFNLPQKITDDSDIEMKVVARRGVLVEEAEDKIEIDREAQIFVSTDKPIYQPGQVLHIRTLMFDATRHAMSDREASLEISDPENKTVFSADLKTTRFGIASADWTIPDNIRLGDYEVKVRLGDNSDEERAGYTYVKISRYDLPNFAVQAKPDLPYYLPGQNAVVEIRADYLFGQPVKRGHVRLVRERERRWNYREQKWEVDEGEKYEGDVDERGLFVAKINLAEEQDKLQEEDYSRFRDLSYAAYVTDPTTNRTEQRRFDLRLTKSAIHVYVIENGELQARGFPLQFYLSTYYADGTPAQCEVAIGRNVTSTNADQTSLTSYEQPLRTVRTNRYGVAKVSGLVLPAQSSGGEDATLIFSARDDKGTVGRQTNSFSFSDHAVLRIETDKTLYRAGEPIKAVITASEPEMRAVVDVWQGATALQSKSVELHGGRASLVIPYNKAFKDGIALTAYSYAGAQSESSYDIPSAMRRIIYPHERDLRVDVRLDQSTYRPGDDAHADFTVRDAQGRAIESALGVVIFDKAVEERARTDSEFGSTYSFYYAYNTLNGYEGELSGLTGRDFYKLDLSKPVPEGMELVAEIMLTGGRYYPHVFRSREYSTDQREIFSKLIARQIKPVEEALASSYSMKSEYPYDEAALRRLLNESGIDLNQQLDPWGNQFRASFSTERESDVLKIKSAGADKRFDTDDDFVVTRLAWPYFRAVGDRLDQAVWQYHIRTGGYIHDAETLQSELAAAGIDWSKQRDRWGEPYRLEFGTSGTNFTIAVRSGGPNGKFETGKETSSDDFTIWTAYADYFLEKRADISATLAYQMKLTGLLPQNEKELRAALEKTRVNLDDLRDPWGHNYYVAFSNDPRYAVPYTAQTYSTYDDAAKKPKEISPLAQPVNLIRFRSAGADGKAGTSDDFDVAYLSRTDILQLSKGQHPQAITTAVLTGASGAITGTITDPQGAVVPNATVTATNISSNVGYTATTDDYGHFTIGNLPAGAYIVKFESPGFKVYVVDNVPVRSSNITRVDGSLEVGAVTESVTVTGGAETFTERSVMSLSMVTKSGINVVTKSGTNNFKIDGALSRQQVSTPRLREYFPETLLWQPSVETDARGRARVDFKLADNITTWKMAVIGSTADGEIGIAEKET
nr:MG2 domain-containing protein [Acidobacteriota bacterium]